MVTITRAGISVLVSGVPSVLIARLQELLSYTRLETQSIRGKITRVSIPVAMWSMRPDGSLLSYVGYVPKIMGFLSQAGVPITAYTRIDRQDALQYDLTRTRPELWRPEQVEFIKGFVEWECGLLVGPTGSGKSYICGEICKMYPAARIIFAAPTIDTVETLCRYLREHAGEEIGQVGGGKKHARRITVSTYDSVTSVSGIERCDILIADEVHRAASEEYAKSFAAITSPLKRFGFTATEDGRSDKAEWMTEALFGPIVVNIPYQASVASGSVVPLEIIVHENPFGPTQATLDLIRKQSEKDREAIWMNRGRNQLIARDVTGLMGVLGNPQTLVLVDKIEHLLALHHELPDFEIAYGNLDQKNLAKLNSRLGSSLTKEDILNLKDRERTRKRFETGEAKRVLATSIFATGVSSNACGLVAVASGSGAPIAFIQSIGRGSRTDDGKSFAVCLFWEDVFSRTYRSRSRKLIATAHAKGHRIHRIPASEGVERWTPPA
jgi:superfamily II DNA or RNA helicase